jgi:hypothetical protein
VDRTQFPWRPLGALLVAEGLVAATELELALAEQRRTGRLLGEILVDRGYVSAPALARALTKQHGVQLAPSAAPDPKPVSESTRAEPAPSAPTQAPTWRPLGTLLVEKGFVSAARLSAALAEQREHPGRRLGEILVAGGHLSGRGLAIALADQHGVAVESDDFAPETETVVAARAPEAPTYRVWDVAYEPVRERRSVVYETANFLEAADFACEFVDRERPNAVEIERSDGASSETVWTYSEARAAAAEAQRTTLAETFGFDPTRWDARL